MAHKIQHTNLFPHLFSDNSERYSHYFVTRALLKVINKECFSLDGSTPAAKSTTGPLRSGLFGKAVSSATGKMIGVRPSMSQSRPSAASRIGTSTAAPYSRPQPEGVVKREPVPEGLYDDLPPPSDWNEDSLSSQQQQRSKVLS